MNEVQRLATFDALGSLVKDEQQTQDPNGNRIRSGEFRLSFDVFDRLVRVERTSDGQTVGRYRYDALGRRVDRWFVAKGEAVGQQVFHVSDGAQEVEEIGASGNVVADYVWGGLYLDQVVQVRRGGQQYFAHTNSIFSVAAITDASGAVVERYEYASIYGVCEVRDAAGVARPASEEVGNPWRFQGRRYDPETGFYYFRLRYLDPEQGRFVNRDPLGIWGDAGNLGNGYAFAGNDPVNMVDPWGLDDWSPKWEQFEAETARRAGEADRARENYVPPEYPESPVSDEPTAAPEKSAWSEFWGGIREGLTGLGEMAVRVTSVPLNATRALVGAQWGVLTGQKGVMQAGGELASQAWNFGTAGPKGLYQFGADLVGGLSGEPRAGGRAIVGLGTLLVVGRSGSSKGAASAESAIRSQAGARAAAMANDLAAAALRNMAQLSQRTYNIVTRWRNNNLGQPWSWIGRPGSIAVVIDILSGRIFIGRSGGPNPTTIHPTLQARAQGIPNGSLAGGRPPQVCAEFRAVNEALLQGSTIGDLVGASTNVFEGGAAFPRCANCRVTSQGATFVTDH